jgi:hypothetical protein
VPTVFRLGGVFQIWAPFHSRGPPKKFSGKQNFFRKMLATAGGGGGGGGGGVDVIFSKTKVPEIFRKNQFQHARVPSPQVGPPFFTFPPRWHGPAGRLLCHASHAYSR